MLTTTKVIHTWRCYKVKQLNNLPHSINHIPKCFKCCVKLDPKHVLKNAIK